jgi:hypothetical protein
VGRDVRGAALRGLLDHLRLFRRRQPQSCLQALQTDDDRHQPARLELAASVNHQPDQHELSLPFNLRVRVVP